MTSNKRAAVSSTASSSSSAGNNGLKLSKTGRSLPFSLESHILGFCDVAELASLLYVSHDMEDLVHGHFRAIGALRLNFSKRFADVENFEPMRARLLRTLVKHTGRLQRIAILDVAELDPPFLWTTWLIELIAANRRTLRVLLPSWEDLPVQLVFALATCPELREFHASRFEGDDIEAEAALQLLFRSCKKLERVMIRIAKPETLTALLSSSLPLIAVELAIRRPESISQLGSLANRGLTDLDIGLEGRMTDLPALWEALGEQLVLLPKLQRLRLLGPSIELDSLDLSELTWDLPACTSLDLTWFSVQPPMIRAPKLTSFRAHFVTLTSHVLRILEQAPELKTCTLHMRHDRTAQQLSEFTEVFRKVRFPEMEEFHSDEALPNELVDIIKAWPKLRTLHTGFFQPLPCETVESLLKELPQLRSLSLYADGVQELKAGQPREARAEPKCTLKHLETLSLDGCGVDDALLTAFDWPQLTYLKLSSPSVRVRRFENAFARMPACMSLVFSDDAEVRMTSVAPVLESEPPLAVQSLTIRSSNCDQNDIWFLMGSAPRLTSLHIGGSTPLKTAHLQMLPLQPLPKLRSIHVDVDLGAFITDKDVCSFIELCPQLAQLTFTSTSLYPATVDELMAIYRHRKRAVAFSLIQAATSVFVLDSDGPRKPAKPADENSEDDEA